MARSMSDEPDAPAPVSGAPWERYAALAGIIFVIMLAISLFAFPEGASSSDPADRIAAYYAQHHATDLISDYWSLAASIPFIVFLTGLGSRLRRAEGDTGMLPILAFASGLLAWGFELIATAVEFALASSVYTLQDPNLVKALYVVASREFLVSNLFFAFFLGAASVVILRTLTLPRWIGWLGLAGSVSFLLSAFSIADPHGPLGLALLVAEALAMLWILLTGVYMLRRAETRRSALHPSPASERLA